MKTKDLSYADCARLIGNALYAVGIVLLLASFLCGLSITN